jgi:hypothetical protein
VPETRHQPIYVSHVTFSFGPLHPFYRDSKIAAKGIPAHQPSAIITPPVQSPKSSAVESFEVNLMRGSRPLTKRAPTVRPGARLGWRSIHNFSSGVGCAPKQ